MIKVSILLGIIGTGMVLNAIGLTIVMGRSLRGFGRVDLQNLRGWRMGHAA
jgi:hypothetical protein